MKRMTRTMLSVVALVVLCAMVSGVAFAAGDGLWLTITGDGKTLSTWILADVTVTDGRVVLHYDSEKLTFQDVECSKDFVANIAVNADQAGTVKIAWVAPEAYTADGTHALVKVIFAGTGKVTGSGAINGGEEKDLTVKNTQIPEIDPEQTYPTEAPETTVKPGKPGGDNASTGDVANPGMMIAVCLAALAGCTGLVAGRKVMTMKKEG